MYNCADYVHVADGVGFSMGGQVKRYFYISQYRRCTDYSALPFTPGRPFHFAATSSSLGSIPAAITREDYSLTFPPLSVARYTFIQLDELVNRGEN